MESKSQVRETEVRDGGQGSKCKQGELRVSSKRDNRNIRESVRKNQKETDDPVGSEVNLNMSEMGQSIGGGDEASEGHGGLRDEP